MTKPCIGDIIEVDDSKNWYCGSRATITSIANGVATVQITRVGSRTSFPLRLIHCKVMETVR